MKSSSPQQTLYKPSHPIEKLADEHVEHLENILNGGLLRSVTPDHIEQHFIKQGFIRKATGGLVPTEAGSKAYMQWQKENPK